MGSNGMDSGPESEFDFKDFDKTDSGTRASKVMIRRNNRGASVTADSRSDNIVV